MRIGETKRGRVRGGVGRADTSDNDSVVMMTDAGDDDGLDFSVVISVRLCAQLDTLYSSRHRYIASRFLNVEGLCGRLDFENIHKAI